MVEEGLVIATPVSLIILVSDRDDVVPACPRGARVVRTTPASAGGREAASASLLIVDVRRYAVEALLDVRHDPAFAHTPVVVLADDERDGRVAALDADEILAPPFATWPAGRRLMTLLALGDARLTGAARRRYESGTFPFVAPNDESDLGEEGRRLRFEHLAAMGTMVAGFAHEIRNPMASLRSIAEALNDELQDAGVELPHVDRMLKVLERVERLVRTSLLFGRPSAPRPSPHAPPSIVSAAAHSVLTRTGTAGEEVVVELEPSLPNVYVDDAQLVQILVILLSNAIDATQSARRVLLRAERHRPRPDGRGLRRSEPPPQDQVRFDVVDDGPGVPAEIMGRIFDPFFTTRASGTGLGLSIARQLAIENGLRLAVASTPGGPTTFSVLVPVAIQGTQPPPRT